MINTTIVELIPRYKRLLDSGQIETSITPYYHPILPLLIDQCYRRCHVLRAFAYIPAI